MARASARRHAQAVFQIALERNELERWRSELRTIASALSQPELVAVLESPKLHFSEKAELVNRCLPGLSQLALNLAHLLVARSRLGIADQIAMEYERLVDAHHGLEHAEVITAIPLDEKEKARLAERLSLITGARVSVSTRVDPKVLGGLVARVGDKLIDGSTRGRLEALRKSLVETAR